MESRSWSKIFLVTKLSLVLLFECILSTSAIANTPCKQAPYLNYTAQYVLYWHGLRAGVSNHTFTHLPNGQYRLETQAIPAISFLPYRYNETSYFKVEENTPIPLQFISKGEEGGKSKSDHLIFDWKKGTVSNVVTKKLWEQQIEKGTQDKLTHFFMLRHELLNHIKPLTYKVAEESHLREYNFTHLGHHRIKTKIGWLDTILLQHENPLNQRKTRVWLSEKHDYMIVKMEQYRKAKLFIRGEIHKLQYPSA